LTGPPLPKKRVKRENVCNHDENIIGYTHFLAGSQAEYTLFTRYLHVQARV
jgi:hypothetical protein